MNLKKRIHESGLGWPLTALGAILIFNLLFTKGFFHIAFTDGHLYGSLIDIAYHSVPTMILAIGMTWVIATGGVDLSVGSITAISGAVAAIYLKQKDSSLALALIFALLAGTVAGAWNGLLVAYLRVQPIVATLVLMVAGRGIAQLLTDGQIISVENPSFLFLGRGFFLGVPFAVVLALLLYLVAALFVRKTALGLFIESVGNNPVASRYTGLNSAGIKCMVYIASGFFAGIAGLLIAAGIGAADVNNSGQYIELDAILSVVLGGTALTGGRFSILGSAVGALIIQSLTTTINTRGIDVQWTLVVKATVILAACLLQSPAFRKTFSFSRRQTS
jgi:simple sugar transport system permease protein